MSEIMGWLVVLALGIAIACIFMLSGQLEQHTRRTAEMMYRSNELLLTQLERIAGAPAPIPDPTVGVMLDRRIAQRRDPMSQVRIVTGSNVSRELPRRRLDDLLSV